MTGEISIKVIIRDGTVESVLCDDTRLPISVEIVDVNKSYPDYQELRDYSDCLYDDNSYKEILPTYANFTGERAFNALLDWKDRLRKNKTNLW